MKHSRIAALLAAGLGLMSPPTAAGSALGALARGEAVEVSGQWDRSEWVFVASRIEKLHEGRKPSARGAIDAVDRRAASFTLFGREIRVDEATVYVADSAGTPGRFNDLAPGMRVEVGAEAEPAGSWKATRIAWGGVKASDKVKGTVTGVDEVADTAQAVLVSGLEIRVTEATDLKTDYLEGELLGTLFSDEGEANAPRLRLGPLRLAGYGRMTTYRDDGYTLSGADDDSMIGQPAVALQAAGDWSARFQTLADLRLASDQSWVGRRFDVTNARLEVLQAYGVLRMARAKGVILSVGKQRVRDSREWLLDEYLDAVRLYLTVARPVVLEASYLPSVFAARGEKFETWDDVLLRVRLIPDTRNEASAYWLKRRDSSPRRRQPIYAGLSYNGRPTRWLRGWLEASLLRGEDKGQPQRAHAFDLGATVSTTGRVRPNLTLAFAVGSGDEDRPGDRTSEEFRQTGYEDNTGRFVGFSSFQYYGEVLDPELANIEATTAGVGVRVGYRVSVDLVGHQYRQHRAKDEMRAALTLAPDGSSRDLGHEVDVIVGVQNLFRYASAAYGFGVFMPGEALVTTDRRATRHRVSVRVGF